MWMPSKPLVPNLVTSLVWHRVLITKPTKDKERKQTGKNSRRKLKYVTRESGTYHKWTLRSNSVTCDV